MPGHARRTIGPALGGLLPGIVAAGVLATLRLSLDEGSFRLFVTQFLSLFIEAAPFLLMGSIVSGFLEMYLRPETLLRFVPSGRLGQVLAGSLAGMILPVCECGIVPVARRLLRKGLPPTMAIALLLAAPALNPIVLFSTFKAFGLGSMLLWRAGGTLLVASAVALLVGPAWASAPAAAGPDAHRHSRSVHAALRHASDDFLGTAGYLVLGAALASLLRTVVPPEALLPVAGNPVLSVLALQMLAFVLSLCSTVDAFIALGFAGTFTGGSILSFLVFGPMLDVKSILLLLGNFPRRPVLQMAISAALLSFLLGVALNLLPFLR